MAHHDLILSLYLFKNILDSSVRVTPVHKSLAGAFKTLIFVVNSGPGLGHFLAERWHLEKIGLMSKNSVQDGDIAAENLPLPDY